MIVKSPKGIPYPVRVKSLLVEPGHIFKRSSPILTYSYQSWVVEGNEFGEDERVHKTYYDELPSEVEGSVTQWLVEKGQEITKAGVSICNVEETCKHEVQFGGLCVNCGRDMTLVDFRTTRPNTDRANISMFTQPNLKVSREEAGRSTEDGMRRLLRARKLTLVVDLDQTIIHTTCDPTVAEWRADETNPNYEAVKDVQSFELHDHGPERPPCSYHVKMRPGLKEFLEKVSKLYEMHIYTMATRSYAENVAKIVDPDGKYFGHRILSRDESGSLERKSLHRLFPVDTKMVVIIDDRADIWNYSHNLVRVRVYNFYVGTGDINSSFLPKLPDEAKPADVPASIAESLPKTDNMDSNMADSEDPEALSIEESLVRMAERNELTKVEEQSQERQAVIEAQIHERPLLKEQEKLEQETERRSSEASTSSDSESDVDDDDASSTPAGSNSPVIETTATTPQTSSPSSSDTTFINSSDSPQNRHPLLHNDDDELTYIAEHLERVHTAFYNDYDSTLTTYRSSLPIADSTSNLPLTQVPDVKILLPHLKSTVLDGTILCMTGLIQIGRPHDTSDLGLWARSFGAQVSPLLIPERTTHVVAGREHITGKVRQAVRLNSRREDVQQRGGIEIVDKMWLFDCFSKWEWLAEDPYRIQVEDTSTTVENEPDDEDPAYAPTDGEDSGKRNGVSGRKALSINTDAVRDEDGDGDVLHSPSTAIEENDWADMEEELNEFLGSDSDSEDFDPDNENSDDDHDDNDHDDESGEEGDKAKANPKKRKRSRASSKASNASVSGSIAKKEKLQESEDKAENEGSSADEEMPELGSELQRRKRKALERTSSLSRMVVSVTDAGGIGKKVNGKEDRNEDEDEEDDDGLEAALEAAFDDED